MEIKALIFTFVLFVGVANSAHIPVDERVSSDQLANISLRIYPGQTIDEFRAALIGNVVDLLEQVDPSKPTVLYISGWTETPDSRSVALVLGGGESTSITLQRITAYLERQDHNILLVDYREIAAQGYIAAIASAEVVGVTVAGALNDLVSSGLDPERLHIVSHSLGSQVAGFIGRNVNFKLHRITGLDPAGPGFNVLIPSLSADDAEFVDVILTDGGLYGHLLVKATATFYPNGGTRVQNGCPTIFLPLSSEAFCSHHRSWQYYAESVKNENAFLGVECDSYASFQRGSCETNTKVVMGYGAPITARGSIYLDTNSESPFGQG